MRRGARFILPDTAHGTDESSPAWLFPALCVVPALLCLLLFAHGAGKLPFWRDEVWSVSIAERSLGGTLAVLWHREANMGLYYVLLNGWQQFGSSEAFIRALSVVFAVAAVPMTMVFVRREFGLAAAVISGFALAFNAFLAIYAKEARAYALIVFLAPLVFLLFVRAVDLQRPRDWALYVVVAAMMVYAQMLSGLLLVAQFASLPLLAPTEKQRRQAIRSLLALVVLCLPLAAFVLLRNKGQADWIPATTLDEIRSIPRNMTGNYGVEFVYGVLFLVALANLVKEVRSARRDREVWIRGLVLLWVVVPAVLLIAISFVKPLLRTPYLIGILPGLTVLAGATIVDLSRRTVAIALTALLALFTVANVVTRDNPPPKVENLRDAATIVNERGEPGDGLAYMPAWSRVGFSYYLDRLKGSHSPSFVDASIAKGGTPVEQGDVLAREASPATVRKRMMSRRRIWLIWYRGGAGGWHPGPDPVSTVAPALLRKDFVRVGSWRFGQIRVNLFRNRSGPVYH